jgi:6-pyruvoyltetrahydropterin/6-carboxytetrahydropterin synthase
MRITRRYRFSASHRLHSPDLSASENQRLYGKCNNPFGHGHDYILEVTAEGRADPQSGLILELPRLDRLIEQKVLHTFANRNINLDIAEFASVVPTTENMALMISRLLQQNWIAFIGKNSSARVVRVHLQETDRNGFEVLLPAVDRGSTTGFEAERITVHA